jgi:hypothetical protein
MAFAVSARRIPPTDGGCEVDLINAYRVKKARPIWLDVHRAATKVRGEPGEWLVAGRSNGVSDRLIDRRIAARPATIRRLENVEFVA